MNTTKNNFLIDKQTAINILHICLPGIPLKRLNEIFAAMPPAQPERKTGRITYTHHSEELWGQSAICISCGCKWQIAEGGEDNFCPNCGADMRERRTDDE